MPFGLGFKIALLMCSCWSVPHRQQNLPVVDEIRCRVVKNRAIAWTADVVVWAKHKESATLGSNYGWGISETDAWCGNQPRTKLFWSKIFVVDQNPLFLTFSGRLPWCGYTWFPVWSSPRCEHQGRSPREAFWQINLHLWRSSTFQRLD